MFGKKKISEKELMSSVIDLNGFHSVVASLDETMGWLTNSSDAVRTFNDMLSDARIGSLVENRQDKILRLDMGQVDGEDEAINEAYRSAIDYNKIQKLGLQLLNALPYGISVSEVIWKKEAGLLIPADFIPIPRSLIRFSKFETGDRYTPILITNNQPLNTPYKFIIHRNDRGTGSVEGLSILRQAYWPWQFKKLGFKFWTMAAERIGVPSILALFETTTDVEAQKRANLLADILHQIRSGSSLALGNVKEVKYLNAEGAIKDFDVLINTCNTEISYGLTGQSLTTNEAQYGTRANAVLHDDTFAAVITKDAQALQSSIQVLYDWFCELNFPGKKPLAFEIDAGESAPWEMITKAVELGIPVSKRALYNRHKLPEPENDADSFVSSFQNTNAGSETEFSDNLKKKELAFF
ncbi:phage portal protein family protein [Treponema pedis]|uniref:phage portal protein family protein n=1 Tax=Treponema pedis TaxID=409322 RepID=UPI0031423236